MPRNDYIYSFIGVCCPCSGCHVRYWECNCKCTLHAKHYTGVCSFKEEFLPDEWQYKGHTYTRDWSKLGISPCFATVWPYLCNSPSLFDLMCNMGIQLWCLLHKSVGRITRENLAELLSTVPQAEPRLTNSRCTPRFLGVLSSTCGMDLSMWDTCRNACAVYMYLGINPVTASMFLLCFIRASRDGRHSVWALTTGRIW